MIITYDILIMLPPLYRHKKGVSRLNLFFSFITSVMAKVVAYYICKWLDRK